MQIKTYIYIFLLFAYGVMHLIRVYDGVYKGTPFIESGSLYGFERHTIPFFCLGFIVMHFFIPLNDGKPHLDWLLNQGKPVPWIFLGAIVINFFVLRDYPVKWERNLCIALPTIIVLLTKR